MPTARINGIDLFYELHGSGPPLVMVHGALGNRLGWWQQVPTFSRQFTCVTVDQRGFGRSIEKEGGPGVLALPDDLAALLTHLALGPAVLIGQSLGGWTCLDVALRHPQSVSALILADTHAKIHDEQAAAIQNRRRENGEIPKEMHKRALSAQASALQPELYFLYFQLSALNPPQPPDYLEPFYGARSFTAQDLARLAAPTLFIVGEDDIGTPPQVIRLLARHVPGAKLREIPKAGHSPYFETAALFNEAVLEFLREVSG